MKTPKLINLPLRDERESLGGESRKQIARRAEAKAMIPTDLFDWLALAFPLIAILIGYLMALISYASHCLRCAYRAYRGQKPPSPWDPRAPLEMALLCFALAMVMSLIASLVNAAVFNDWFIAKKSLSWFFILPFIGGIILLLVGFIALCFWILVLRPLLEVAWEAIRDIKSRISRRRRIGRRRRED